MEGISSKDLYRKLEGRDYPTYRELHDAVLTVFNQHLTQFPPGYSYLQFLEWGKRKRWIKSVNGSGFRVKVDPN